MESFRDRERLRRTRVQHLCIPPCHLFLLLHLCTWTGPALLKHSLIGQMTNSDCIFFLLVFLKLPADLEVSLKLVYSQSRVFALSLPCTPERALLSHCCRNGPICRLFVSGDFWDAEIKARNKLSALHLAGFIHCLKDTKSSCGNQRHLIFSHCWVWNRLKFCCIEVTCSLYYQLKINIFKAIAISSAFI